MNGKLVEEFLSFLEVRKLKFESYRKKAEGKTVINVDEFLDVLIETDQIILKTLKTFKELSKKNSAIKGEKEEKYDLKQLMIDYNYTEVPQLQTNHLQMNQSIIPEYTHNTNILTLNELISLPKEEINQKLEVKKNTECENNNYKKRMYVWNILKKLHLNEQFRSYFGRKFGQGSFEVFKRKILSNNFSEKVFNQIVFDTESFLTLNKINIDINMYQ